MAGYCPGDSNNICCEEAVSCDSGLGICIDTDLQDCDGILKVGYCDGANNIMCCEPASVLPSECLGSAPLMNSTYEFTLSNQGFEGHPGALVYVPSNFDFESTDLVQYFPA